MAYNTAPDGLDKFLAGTTDAFGGPAANANAARRSRLVVILLVVCLALPPVVAVLGFVALTIAMVHIADSKPPVTAMPAIAAEAPGRTEASCPPASTGPALSPAQVSTMPGLGTVPLNLPSAVAPAVPIAAAPAPPSLHVIGPTGIAPAAARTQIAAWWTASHANSHMSRHRRDVPVSTPMSTPGYFGCPASLGAACAAQQ